MSNVPVKGTLNLAPRGSAEFENTQEATGRTNDIALLSGCRACAENYGEGENERKPEYEFSHSVCPFVTNEAAHPSSRFSDSLIDSVGTVNLPMVRVALSNCSLGAKSPVPKYQENL